MKIIDLLNKIANGEEVPKRIKISDNYYHFDTDDSDYYNDDDKATLMENIYLHNAYVWLNKEAEILDDEEDKDIPLIPDDELNIMTGFGIKKNDKLNYNFKVLKEKINQVVEELNKRQ